MRLPRFARNEMVVVCRRSRHGKAIPWIDEIAVFSLTSFSLMKKKQKIKKVRSLTHRQRCSTNLQANPLEKTLFYSRTKECVDALSSRPQGEIYSVD